MSFTYENCTINTKPTFWWQDATTTKIGDYTLKYNDTLTKGFTQEYTCNWVDSATITTEKLSKEWQDAINKVLGIKNEREDDKYMYKNYYNVIVISTKGRVVLDTKVLADNEEDAKFEADVHVTLKATKLSLGDVTVLITNLGRVKLEKEGDK